MKPELINTRQKYYINVKEGTELYSMSAGNFRRFAKEANATIPLGTDRHFIVDCRVFEHYLEVMRDKG